MVTTEALVPVTIIGGYLGAGKTTLINRLLAGTHGRRLAVLVNDFGAIAVDADLIAAHDGETLTLANGCVCCSIADALGERLDEVLALDPPPDQIVVEASGVADVAKVAAYGQGWPGCRLDAVLVLADGETIEDRAADRFVGALVVAQLRAADLVLVTKGDLVDEAALEATIRWLAGIATAPVQPAERGVIDPAVVLDLGPTGRTAEPAAPQAASAVFESAIVSVPPELDADRLGRAIARWPDSVLRAKGLVALTDGSFVVQRVGRRCSVEPTAPSAGGTEGGNAIVVIGRSGTIDPDALGAHLT